MPCVMKRVTGFGTSHDNIEQLTTSTLHNLLVNLEMGNSEKNNIKISKYSRQVEFPARKFLFSENTLESSVPTTHFIVG